MNMLKKWLLVAAIFFSGAAFANTVTSDLSDTWWNESEPGWGVNVNHQRDVVFLTFFIYGANGRVSWFTGQTTNVGQNTQGALIFAGNMYEFSGPWYGAAFNPANVSGRNAGTVTFTASLDSAILSYTIDGVVVYKVVTRQTFRHNDLSGGYMGGIKQIESGCKNPAGNGETNAIVDLTVTNTPTTFSMTARKGDGSTCNYVGNYTQTGRLGRSQGTYTCGGGMSGTYDAFELEASIQSFSGRYLSSDSACDTVTGRFAGMRK